MIRSFELLADASLGSRLLTALDTAEEHGGDSRGRQSAALLVASGTKPKKSWEQKLIDLRVDDSETPLVELRRLPKVHQSAMYMQSALKSPLLFEGTIDRHNPELVSIRWCRNSGFGIRTQIASQF